MRRREVEGDREYSSKAVDWIDQGEGWGCVRVRWSRRREREREADRAKEAPSSLTKAAIKAE